ncbi:PadR family transcriptional regulator [Gryllotalpicola ginsengisoli]|uniref:PadR family transcriptional regulator n=1 Tax=Gryllotalpicola ginsengisoli TaxID=444608 RepID=UPI0003B74DBE|nr:PadR family transcriptional regulator [Gryllotalpicola ginsengisoli]
MSTSFTGAGTSSRGFGGGRPGAGPSLSDAFDQLRSAVEQRLSPRGRPGHDGDVRSAVLALLAERPMHGYELIAEIGERSNGSWKPTAGEVYPTLQLLTDEGVIEADAADGRKTYSLTAAGKAEADAAAERAPGPESRKRDLFGIGPLPKAGMELAQAAAQVQRSGTPEQQQEAAKLLDEVRRKLYAILAQE